MAFTDEQRKDTGSPEVQVGILTARINSLTEHVKAHVKDHIRLFREKIPGRLGRRTLQSETPFTGGKSG